MEKILKNHNIYHYAWIIVLICAVVQMVGAAIRIGFGVLVDPLVEIFGWSSGSIGLAYALMSIITAFSSPIAGLLCFKIGCKKTMIWGTILFFIGMIWISQISQIWELYISYGLVFGVAQAFLLVPAVPIVSNWFDKYLGLGTGLMMGAWSLGPAISVQILAIFFEIYGWRDSFIIIGITGTLVLLIFLFFLKDTPEEIKKLPYGFFEKKKSIKNRNFSLLEQKNIQRLIYKKNEFWNLINIHFLGCVSHSIILVGIIPMGINAGLSSLTAAGLLTTLSIISIISRVITPIIADKYGSKPIMFFSLFGQGIGVLILLNATQIWEFYTFAVLWAIPYGGEGAAFPIINRQYFGKFPIGTTYGWQVFGAGLGMALGGILPGIIYDLNNSYNLAIILSALFSIFASIIILFLKNTKKEIIPT
ncbi:MAG: MFS transporter [SAR202 cluster bacterium]|nr:MFS transporter [SAR202 cluster bacterium]|tara:strand:+ start:7929 stop:9185 length:1257 start_codon:yes stop_codon:yes gene_type:complete